MRRYRKLHRANVWRGFVGIEVTEQEWETLILYGDKVIILYNSNDRETKRLSKKQLSEIFNAENLEEIKENSSEPRGFKRAYLGGELVTKIE